jgi:8-oxo-dGTP pyrophosphatase MutT (NUDIX family)
VRAALDAHRAGDRREDVALRRVVAALDGLERPFDEFAGPEHVTGSAIVVGPRGTVLHVHKRLGRWLQPGGHLEPGEGPWDAARREAEEETGLAVAHPSGGPRLVHVDVHPAAKGHTHLDLRYLLVGPDRDPAPPPGESPEVRWFGWEEAESVADAALVGALRAARCQPEVSGPGGGGRAGGGGPGGGGHRRGRPALLGAVGSGGNPRHNGDDVGTARHTTRDDPATGGP